MGTECWSALAHIPSMPLTATAVSRAAGQVKPVPPGWLALVSQAAASEGTGSGRVTW